MRNADGHEDSCDHKSRLHRLGRMETSWSFTSLQDRTDKTTFAREFLANYADCKNFVNADLIAHGTFSPRLPPCEPAERCLGRSGHLPRGEFPSLSKLISQAEVI
jgi:hypothetical protein